MNQREEIKNKTDIVQLIGKYVPLKKPAETTKPSVLSIPKTPSFMVSPELQIYKCFGCGKDGDVFTFLMDAEGMDFSESLHTLAEAAGIKLASFCPSSAARQYNRSRSGMGRNGRYFEIGDLAYTTFGLYTLLTSV